MSLHVFQKANEKGCEALKEWVPDILTHFWKSAEVADGDPEKFKVGIIVKLPHNPIRFPFPRPLKDALHSPGFPVVGWHPAKCKRTMLFGVARNAFQKAGAILFAKVSQQDYLDHRIMKLLLTFLIQNIFNALDSFIFYQWLSPKADA